MSRLRSTLRAAVTGALLLPLAACLDVGAPAGARRASLRLEPVFASSGARDAFASDVDSFVITIANSLNDTSYHVRLDPGQDSILLNVSVVVNTGLDTIGVAFEGYSATTGLRLYAGTQSFVLLGGLPQSSQSVPVAYVGPGGRIGAIDLTPSAAGLQPGQTVTFAYTATDTTGATMVTDSVPVRFISRNTAVVTVNQSGVAQAVADGSAYVLVRSLARSSVQDSALVTVAAAAPPLIGLTPGSITFNDTVGTTNPPAQNVNVSNVGGQTLTGLSLGTTVYGAGATGWLTANLGTPTAPTTVTLAVNNASLAPGTYTATVPVLSSGAGNSPQNIGVTINVSPSALVSIALAPGFLAARPGDTLTLQVTGRNATGATVPVANVGFVSRTPGVATVNATTGRITAVAGGTTVVVATVGGTAVADSMVVAVAANGSALVSAVADSRWFDVRQVGDTVRLRVAVDLRGIAPEKLGSYDADLTWTPARLTFVRAAEVAGGWSGAFINCPTGSTGGGCAASSNNPAGTVSFAGVDAAGRSGAVALLEVTFVAASAGPSGLLLVVTEMSATSATNFTNLMPAAAILTGVVRIQ